MRKSKAHSKHTHVLDGLLRVSFEKFSLFIQWQSREREITLAFRKERNGKSTHT